MHTSYFVTHAQFAAKNLLEGSLRVHQHLSYYPGGHYNCPARCSVQCPVAVCSSSISGILHVSSRVPVSVEVSGEN